MRAAGAGSRRRVGGHLGAGADANAFWAKAGDNLRAGRIRLVLVADLISPELRRIIEFMNAQMQPIELLAVELRQYQGEGLRALAPLVVGQSQESVQRKRTTPSPSAWTPETILQALEGEPAAHAAASEIMAWTHANADKVNVTASGATGPLFRNEGSSYYPFLISRQGELTLFFDFLAAQPVYAVRERRQAWAQDLVAAGLPIDPNKLDGRQSVRLSSLAPAVTTGFLSAMKGFVARLSQNKA